MWDKLNFNLTVVAATTLCLFQCFTVPPALPQKLNLLLTACQQLLCTADQVCIVKGSWISNCAVPCYFLQLLVLLGTPLRRVDR